MINLLQETIECLKEQGKTPNDVLWVGTLAGSMSWEDFSKLADKKYDNGYGGTEVNETLLVVGKDWWLERWEYDGSEGWVLKEFPERPKIESFVQTIEKTWSVIEEEMLAVFID